MPGMVVFGRRWRISSDDLVFPGAFKLFIRAVWWIVTLVLYTNHKGRFDCQGGANLHNYLIVLLVLLAVIILTLCAVVYFSAQGTIMNAGPRRSVPALVFLRALLYIPELVWACLGAVWVSDNSTGCEPAEVGFVIGAVVSRTQTWFPVTSPLVCLFCIRNRTKWSTAGTLMRGKIWRWSLRKPLTVCSLPLYVYSNPLTGICRLGGDCCRNRHVEHDLIGGENLGCHFSSMLQSTGLQYRDFIHISVHNQIYEIPFSVALDHQREAVLVAVRGTLSLKDVLTDLSAECENLSVEGFSGACYAHKGISQAAHYIYKRLVNDGIPEYKLVITGHSLGAGATSLLAVLLRSTRPTLQCYAFSPPGGLMRLSIPNMEDLKRRLLKMVSNCSKPKYKILMHGCWYELFRGTPDDFPTELETRREELLNQPLLGEESLLLRCSSSYQSLSPDESPPRLTHLPLYLPGRVLHITEDRPARRHCFSQVRYCAEWSSEASFCNVLISPRMIADHMPDVVLRALRSLTHEHPLALCSSSISNSHLNVI